MKSEQLVLIAKEYVLMKKYYLQSIEMNSQIDKVKFHSIMKGIEKTLELLGEDLELFNDVVHDLEHGLN